MKTGSNLKQKTQTSRNSGWTAEELKLLGRVPDSVLTQRTGRTIKEVVIGSTCVLIC